MTMNREIKATEQNSLFGYEMMNLDVPVIEMTCGVCGITAKPSYQIRLAADESGQKTDAIFWDCSKCTMHNITADDVSILSSPIILDK